ncbi:TIGR01212 family radical SAM protein [Clostridium boliviensis]|uniref:TIGR01212 family radical SAM protein n=1 Tax=Clostridium boliviensis TaxID=318465 RepID=A0ABU4GJG6_9CLOT|nr:TIGR01212 family radical SAM protein [Clostridium boliviensis]MDW2797130.1 TIGR01212 family radical SAM protein [Clostridium boliviensis]
MLWNDKPYHSLDYELKMQYGQKVYKLALDGGMTCPNRDGTLGNRGCIFCSSGGSGEFAESSTLHSSVAEQIQSAKKRVASKMNTDGGLYIAYFQSYTNTYAPAAYLRELFTQAVSEPDVVVLSIATRPDCLPPDIILLLKELNQIKPVWVELGLQTIHESTASFIRRGYPLSTFYKAYQSLKEAGIKVIAHVILGLPGESKDMILETVRYLGQMGDHGIDGIKLQLLHILEGTDLADLYNQGSVPVYSLSEYTDLVIDCIALLPPGVVIHRLSGDGPKKLLLAPLWSANKRLVLNTLAKRFKERGICQGDRYLV